MLYDLTITDELRERLNNQHEICHEFDNQIPFVTYDTYISSYHMEGSITSEFIRLLFEQHPEFEERKSSLIITTSKCCKISQYGLNGESNWHIDNINFPSNKKMNLIISWNGQGTSCLPKKESELLESLTREFIQQQRTDYENRPTPYNYPIHPISSYHSTESNHMTLLSMEGKRVLHRRNPINETDIGVYRYVLNIYYDL